MDIIFNKSTSILEVVRLMKRGYTQCYVTPLGIFPYGSKMLEETLISEPHEVVSTSELFEELKNSKTDVVRGYFKWVK